MLKAGIEYCNYITKVFGKDPFSMMSGKDFVNILINIHVKPDGQTCNQNRYYTPVILTLFHAKMISMTLLLRLLYFYEIMLFQWIVNYYFSSLEYYPQLLGIKSKFPMNSK